MLSLFSSEKAKKTLCLQMNRQRVAWVLISMVSESILICAVHIKRESALEQGTGQKRNGIQLYDLSKTLLLNFQCTVLQSCLQPFCLKLSFRTTCWCVVGWRTALNSPAIYGSSASRSLYKHICWCTHPHSYICLRQYKVTCTWGKTRSSVLDRVHSDITPNLDEKPIKNLSLSHPTAN